MLKTWIKFVDKGKVSGVLLTDLSIAFDCLDHELLTAKLNTYSVSLPAFWLINNYLTNSAWLDIMFGVPQNSILGSLLFQDFLADLFLL